MEELEKRLKRVETLLKTAVERDKDGKATETHDQNPFGVIDLELNRESEDQQGAWRPQMITPESTKLGPSPALVTISSLALTPRFRGIGRTQDQSPTMIYEPLLTSQHQSPLWKGSLVRDVFSRRTFQKLPSKSFALALIDDAFKSFNSTFPIFDQLSFMNLFQDHYSESGPSDPGWWACINVILALAHRFRAMRTLETKQENSQACGYMQNALAVVSELTMLHNSLLAVQALLGMTVVIQGTPNPRLCSVLIAAAMRLAQTMGLHRKNQDLALTEAEIEQRKRVFWIAYFLDKDISLRTGQPPAQNDDDMDVELPSETISNLPPYNNGINTISFFNSRIGLAVIQGQVYNRLYAVKAANQSEAEQIFAAHELNAMLMAWKNSVPIDFEEDRPTTLQAPITPDFLHKIILRFTYVNCLITIHQPFLRNGSTAPFDEICVSEARKAVGLIQITPHGDYACAWSVFPPLYSFTNEVLTTHRLLIHYFFAAVTTILHNILCNPTHIFAPSDLQLVEPFLSLLELLAKEGKSEEVQRMFEFCQDLNGKAKDAVTKVNMRMLCSGRKSRGEKESVEDFIRRVECQSRGYTGSGEFVPTTGEARGDEN